jgi:steroid 5-alpha reductase family enzyme
VPDLAEMYRQKSPSTLPKLVLAVLHGGTVVAVAWLLFGGGLAHLAGWLGMTPRLASPLRRGLLLGAAGVYFLRTLATTFVFLKRRMGWAEISTIAVWIGVLHLVFAFLGGRQSAAVGLVEIGAVLLYLSGSYLNSGSEWQRHLWKQQPEHQGQLYVQGLFRYAMHINYFGDVVLFAGWALLTGYLLLLVVPLLMLFGFVFVNIPALDHYLGERYGESFKTYAAQTRKLIPFLY